jgi:putative addiction module component (TIGR02574 family)
LYFVVAQSGVRQHRPALNYPFASPDFAPLIFAMPRKRKVSEIVKEARQLPYGERTELIEQVIADTVRNPDPKIDKAWGDEALRRLRDIEEGKVKGIPLDKAFARVRKTVGP